MAATVALTKIGLPCLRHRHHHINHRLLKTINKHSIPDQVPSPNNVSPNHSPPQLQSNHISPLTPSISQTPISKPLHSSIPPPPPSSSPESSGVLKWYLGMIDSRPIITKSVTAASIYTIADLSSQTISFVRSRDGYKYDWARTLRMAGYGMVVIGPSLHYWFNFASRIFPKRDVASTLKKIALGQTAFGPPATAVFFSGNAALQGESGSEIVARLKRDLIPTLLHGVMYWPACDFVTFKFIPVHLQPLVSNSFSYVWTVYLTYMANLTKIPTQ